MIGFDDLNTWDAGVGPTPFVPCLQTLLPGQGTISLSLPFSLLCFSCAHRFSGSQHCGHIHCAYQYREHYHCLDPECNYQVRDREAGISAAPRVLPREDSCLPVLRPTYTQASSLFVSEKRARYILNLLEYRSAQVSGSYSRFTSAKPGE